MHRQVGLGLASRGDVRDAVEHARRAEAAGLESVWVHDSYFERDPITYLAADGLRDPRDPPRGGLAQPLHPPPVRAGHDALLARRPRAGAGLAGARQRPAAAAGADGIPFENAPARVGEAIDQIRDAVGGRAAGAERQGAADAADVPAAAPHPDLHRRLPRPFLELAGEKADGYLGRPAGVDAGLRADARGACSSRRRRTAGRSRSSTSAATCFALVDRSRAEALEPGQARALRDLHDLDPLRHLPQAGRLPGRAAGRASTALARRGLPRRRRRRSPTSCSTPMSWSAPREDVAARALEYHRGGHGRAAPPADRAGGGAGQGGARGGRHLRLGGKGRGRRARHAGASAPASARSSGRAPPAGSAARWAPSTRSPGRSASPPPSCRWRPAGCWPGRWAGSTCGPGSLALIGGLAPPRGHQRHQRGLRRPPGHRLDHLAAGLARPSSRAGSPSAAP